jgi:hypothetical protein
VAALAGSGPEPSATQRRQMSRTRIGLLALLVVLVLVLAYVTLEGVHVNQVVYSAPDGACDLPTAASHGFTAGAGASVATSLTISNDNATTACMLETIATDTGGFRISGSDVPFTVPAGGIHLLTFTIIVPSG